MTVRFNLLALILITALAVCSSSDDSGSSSNDDNDATQDVSNNNNNNDTSTQQDTSSNTCGGATQCAGNPDCSDTEFCSAGCCTPRSTPTTDTTTGEDCGDIDFLGECQGAEAVWCGDNGLARVDCTTYVPEGSTGACAYVDDELGYWCTTEIGDPCYFIGEDDQPFTMTCAGENAACVLTFEGSACTADVGTCSEDDTNGCYDGTNMLLGCAGTRPILYDCGDAGGTCDEAGEDSQCVGVPAEGACIEGLQACADGLECEGESDTEPGTCGGGEPATVESTLADAVSACDAACAAVNADCATYVEDNPDTELVAAPLTCVEECVEDDFESTADGITDATDDDKIACLEALADFYECQEELTCVQWDEAETGHDEGSEDDYPCKAEITALETACELE